MIATSVGTQVLQPDRVIGACMLPNHHTFLMVEVCNIQHCSLRICFGHVPSLSAIWSNTTQRSSDTICPYRGWMGSKILVS